MWSRWRVRSEQRCHGGCDWSAAAAVAGSRGEQDCGYRHGESLSGREFPEDGELHVYVSNADGFRGSAVKLYSARSRSAGIFPSASLTSPSGAQASSGPSKVAHGGLNMGKNNCLHFFLAGVALGAVVFVSGCSVNVKKEANGQDKQVDINTFAAGFMSASRRMCRRWVGGVSGLTLEGKGFRWRRQSANVTSRGWLRLKVVALEYESRRCAHQGSVVSTESNWENMGTSSNAIRREGVGT